MEALSRLVPRLGPGAGPRLQACIQSIRAHQDLGPLSRLIQELEEGGASSSLAEYDQIISQVEEVARLSLKVGPDVGKAGHLLYRAFTAQREFLSLAAESRKPGDAELQKLLEPTASILSEIQALREANRGNKDFNHLSALSESIPALGWVGVAPSPAPFVREMRDAGQFYANRILRDRKEDKKWVEAWLEVLSLLQDYVKRNHTTGLNWNPAGGEARAAPAKVSAKSTAPPPAEKKAASRRPLAGGPAAAAKAEEAKLELDGKKWMIEHFVGNRNIEVDDVKTNQSVYIYKCQDSVIKVSGKCNNIVVNSCRKVALVFDSLISSCELIGCQGIEMQVVGTVPLISLDKTDGAQIYLSPASLHCEIVTAKSSGLNVLMPAGGDFKEMPIPEQFKTVVAGTKLITVPTEAV